MRKLLYPALFLAIECMYAADPPAMEEGLWSIHTVSIDQPTNHKTDGNQSLCHNHAYDDRVRALAAQQSMKSSCKTVSENSTGGTTTTETKCTVAGSVLDTKAVVTFNGDSAHSETHTTYTPAMYGTSETTMVMDQKYMGACPAGVEPGDRVGADGKIIHRTSK